MAKLPEGVYLRGNKLWIRFTARPGGPQIRMKTGLAKSLPGAVGMAVALRSKLIKEAFEGTWFPGKAHDCTFAEAAAEYLHSIEKTRDAKTVRRRIERAIDFFGADTMVATISQRKIRTWQDKLSSETSTRTKKLRSQQTVLHYLINLRTLFKRAKKARLTTFDPMDGYELPEPSKARTRVATEDEIARLVAGALDNEDKDLADMIILARELGLRQSKIVLMDWSLVSGRIYKVPPTPGGKPVPERVPLSQLAMRVLKSRGMRAEGRIFPGAVPKKISERFSRLVRRLGIKDLRFHDLRHTTFTELERAGVGLRTIKEFSGHRTIENLFRYQTVNDADLIAAVDRQAEAE